MADRTLMSTPPRPRERFHQRLAHRPVYRACVNKVTQDRLPEPRALQWELLTAYGALLARIVFYGVLFFWAARSTMGAAVLQGVVAADVLTFLLIGGLRAAVDGVEWTVDGVFEVFLVALYLHRDTLFGVTTEIEFAATSLFSFLLFVPVRATMYGLDYLIERN